MTKKILVIFILAVAAFSINAKASSETITVECSAKVYRQSFNSVYEVEANIIKEVKLKKRLFNNNIRKINFLDEIKIDDEYTIHFSLSGELNNRNNIADLTLEAELARHRGGNGKIVLGEIRGYFQRKNYLKSIPNINLDLVNMKDLGLILSSEGTSEGSPRLSQDRFLEAVNNGILTEGVVKNAFLKCSAL